MKIAIKKDIAKTVYDDLFFGLYQAMGNIEIVRATDVEFDNISNEWVAVHRETGYEISRGMNRQAVIAAEVAWLEERL